MPKRQFVVIGLGRFGHHVALSLAQKGCEVLAIDSSEDSVAAVADHVTQAVQCDATDEKALRALGVNNFDVAVVSIGENIEASILIVMTIKELGVKEIIAKAVTPIHGKVLSNLGIAKVVFPERDAAIRVANSLVAPNIIDYLELSSNYSIVEIPVAEGMVDKMLKETDIRAKHGLTVIAIRRKVPYINDEGESDFTEELRVSPSADDKIAEGDILVVLGSNNRIASYEASR
ncbi:MAG: TrkA family potassium uptake protein [Nitrospirota bacterium]|nr:TrkA family potassium uptake protein [Nitrospirota bacterium]